MLQQVRETGLSEASVAGQKRCRNFLCRQMFTPSPRFPNSKFCVSCTIDRETSKAQRKAAKPKKCKGCRSRFVNDSKHEKFCSVVCRRTFFARSKQGAIIRRKERSARRKLKKRTVTAYPHAGFASKRKQLSLFEPQCEITGITSKEHIAKFKSDLHLDHIIPARIASERGGNAHADVNLCWLSHSVHAHKKRAEEQLKGRGGMYGFVLELKKMDYPMHRVKAALMHFGLYSDNLPW